MCGIGVYVDGILRYPETPRNECDDAADIAADIVDVTNGEPVWQEPANKLVRPQGHNLERLGLILCEVALGPAGTVV